MISGSVTDYRHYVYAGNEPVAVLSRKSNAQSVWSYFLTDHQGSIAGIISNTGVVDVNESFTAYGARRNPATWSGAPASQDLSTIAGLSRQGYTYQTALGQSMGLNHMNGRVQDALTGRFLSADPHIPHPGATQAYNRYSYVSNNPLKYVDPSGFADAPPNEANSGGDNGYGPIVGELEDVVVTAPKLSEDSSLPQVTVTPPADEAPPTEVREECFGEHCVVLDSSADGTSSNNYGGGPPGASPIAQEQTTAPEAKSITPDKPQSKLQEIKVAAERPPPDLPLVA